MYQMFSHTHQSAWLITVLLFALAAIFTKNGKQKAQKITHMILRLFFIIMLVSGVGSLIFRSFAAHYVVKGILAVALIGLMEMILGRGGRGEKTGMLWIPFIVALLAVVVMGFSYLF
ncbi:hypothetical protein BEP19_08430 [Ammoniphilus oxalaticus]|uniref:Uncharacterized protein n=1 Tax=Ammoniphilus oxalaticus TaxID=66863 RepID=A0A419SKA1_9BACL|nr:DUF1516 family protein [Ammoniphilus oxalaticus]RKD24407.1 hypothetical protein BEP19_08430 [Ammoniphilus oxalaticus]